MLRICSKIALVALLTSVAAEQATTAAPSAFHEFELGVGEALGYKDVVGCFDNAGGTAETVKAVVELYEKGGWYNKAKASVKLAEASRSIIVTLEQCSAATTDLEQYRKLAKNMMDPRYYTLHNACTLALNVAEDRGMLVDFAAKLKKKDFYGAGNEFMHTILDVLERPGIPESNGTAALQIAAGLAVGFGQTVDLPCFKDARVEIPAVIGGVFDCMTGVGIIPGLESLFHGIEGIVPLFKDCYHDKPQIMALLKSFQDFTNPHELARILGHNAMSNGIDISIEVSQSILDIKGKEWKRLGEDVGKILSKILIHSDNSSSTSSVVV